MHMPTRMLLQSRNPRPADPHEGGVKPSSMGSIEVVRLAGTEDPGPLMEGRIRCVLCVCARSPWRASSLASWAALFTSLCQSMQQHATSMLMPCSDRVDSVRCEFNSVGLDGSALKREAD